MKAGISVLCFEAQVMPCLYRQEPGWRVDKGGW